MKLRCLSCFKTQDYLVNQVPADFTLLKKQTGSFQTRNIENQTYTESGTYLSKNSNNQYRRYKFFVALAFTVCTFGLAAAISQEVRSGLKGRDIYRVYILDKSENPVDQKLKPIEKSTVEKISSLNNLI